MEKILTPTDFSDGAFAALRSAMDVCRATGADLIVVNAYAMPSGSTTVMMDISDVLLKNAKDELAALRHKVDKEKLAEGVNVNYRAEYGNVVDVVNNVAVSEGVDLVVMGTTGASGIAGRLLGSNTSAVARDLKKPLLAIPPGTNLHKMEQILFATDFRKPEDPTQIRILRNLAEKFTSSIKVLNVVDDGKPPISEDAKAKFRELAAAAMPGIQLTYGFVRAETVEEGIQYAIDQRKPDMLVLVRHEYGFLEGLFRTSVSRSMLLRTTIPLLVLKG